jgi:spermidine synthase
MTVLWEKTHKNTHYSVRSAGATVRLYSNGVFHSQWNPRRPFAGGIWDCLSLPALYQEPFDVQRILLLGVGGGAVIRQLQWLVPFQSVTAVEIDPIHLRIARRWFDVHHPGVEWIQADAIEWLANYDGPAFDLVIDDLFGHADGEPVRAQVLTPDWMRLLRRVAPTGMVVVNCVSGGELKAALPAMRQAGYQHGYRWTLPTYDNAIAVLLHEAVSPQAWSEALAATNLTPATKRRARATVRRPLRLEVTNKRC